MAAAAPLTDETCRTVSQALAGTIDSFVAHYIPTNAKFGTTLNKADLLRDIISSAAAALGIEDPELAPILADEASAGEMIPARAHSLFQAWSLAANQILAVRDDPETAEELQATPEQIAEDLTFTAADLLRMYRPLLTDNEVNSLEDYVYESEWRAYSGTAE